MKNQIPEVTHKLGKHWKQPQRDCILIDDQHALLSRSDFNKLSEYSSTIPSGVYEGKMWKRLDDLFDPLCKPCDREWLLCWFGFGIDKGRCSINFRKILIAEELTGAVGSNFLEMAPIKTPPEALPPGITGITTHRLRG